jgi:hypothetical protein
MTKTYKKYNHFTMIFPEFLNDLIRRECYEMRVSRQEYIRSIVRAHLSKKYGKDVFLEQHEIKDDIRKGKP